jgi:hypothetical protein
MTNAPHPRPLSQKRERGEKQIGQQRWNSQQPNSLSPVGERAGVRGVTEATAVLFQQREIMATTYTDVWATKGRGLCIHHQLS